MTIIKEVEGIHAFIHQQENQLKSLSEMAKNNGEKIKRYEQLLKDNKIDYTQNRKERREADRKVSPSKGTLVEKTKP